MPSDNLTSLDFLKVGERFPPKNQNARLARYAENKHLFNKRQIVDEATYNMVMQVIGKRFRIVPYQMLLNFYRKISFKTADLLFTEHPTYTAGEENKAGTEVIEEIVANSKLNSIGHQSGIDASRYGDSILLIKKKDIDGKEKAVTTISQPKYWFPVVEPSDLKEFVYHVLAWQVDKGERDDKKKKVYSLQIQIHEKGYVTKVNAKVKQGKIISIDKYGEGVEGANARDETGLTDFAVIPAQGVLTSDSVFAIDDYVDIKDVVDELQIRLAQIARVLDKHADPALSGPTSALTLDESTGEYTLDLANYFKRDNKDDPKVEYITWEGHLVASFTEIEVLMNFLAIFSEMGSAIFDDNMKKVGTISGSAMRMMYVNALNKVARLRNSFDDAFKQAIYLCSQVGYEAQLEKKEIAIMWKDGLPDDPLEKAKIGEIRLGKRASNSVVSEIMEQDNLTLEPAEAKYEQMLIEDMAKTPPAFGGAGEDKEDLETETDEDNEDENA